jgi:hypothetical protein
MNDYMYYYIYLKRKHGNKILYAKVGTEDKLMKLSNHLIKDMNCKLSDVITENNSLYYIIEEPKEE